MTDLKDSNVAAIGSELDKKQRLEAAKTELAWNGVGLKPELVHLN